MKQITFFLMALKKIYAKLRNIFPAYAKHFSSQPHSQQYCIRFSSIRFSSEFYFWSDFLQDVETLKDLVLHTPVKQTLPIFNSFFIFYFYFYFYFYLFIASAGRFATWGNRRTGCSLAYSTLRPVTNILPIYFLSPFFSHFLLFSSLFLSFSFFLFSLVSQMSWEW